MGEMSWRSAGPDGAAFREAVAAAPGWYWVWRPRIEGSKSYDEQLGVQLLVWVSPEGRLQSPMADFQSLSAQELTCFDARDGVRYGTWFAGPVAPGPSEGTLQAGYGRRASGFLPAEEGWRWCRTRAPLMHVDDQGIGPILLQRKDGALWVWLATGNDRRAVEVGELGFSEPLVSDGGVIDGTGTVARLHAEFFGAIEQPGGELPPFSAV